MVLALTLFLTLIAAVLALLATRKGVFKIGMREGTLEFMYLIPRVAIGVIGSGFIAALLPQELIQKYLSSESGITAYILATIAGIITPGGPVVGFALGVGSLKAGASLPVIMTYITAWSLMALQRIFTWEMPIMSTRMTLLRFIGSLPLPFIAGFIFYLFKPL